MFTKTTRGRSSDSARDQTRLVCTSTPITALATTSAPSTTRSAATVSPAKPASPGASIRLILRPCHSRWQIDEASDIWRRCSSSSQSEVVVPPSTVPRRLIAPAWKSIASTSDVFPVPRCPVTATLRIFPGSVGIAGHSSSKTRDGSRSYPRAASILGARCGGRTPSSTRSTRARSRTRTATASATCAGSRSGSNTSSTSASTRSGSRRSTPPRSRTSATTSPTTPRSTRSSGRWSTSTRWWRGRTSVACVCCSTSSSRTPRSSTPGSASTPTGTSGRRSTGRRTTG